MEAPHFVLRRGHRGRYKFHLSLGAGRLSGDLTVNLEGTTRRQQDSEALRVVKGLASALAEQASLPHTGTDDVPMRGDAGARDRRVAPVPRRALSR